MDKELSYLLAKIATYSVIIPGLLALYRIKSPVYTHRILSVLVLGSAFISLFAHFVIAYFKWPNLFLLHFYTIFNFIITTLIFKSDLNKKASIILITLFTSFAAINSIFIERLQTFNVLSRSISAFIIMVYVLRFFTKTLREMKIQELEKVPLFWISVGALFYNAGSFFIFLFSKDISPFEELWLTYFGVHSILTIILYCFYTIALWVRPTV